MKFFRKIAILIWFFVPFIANQVSAQGFGQSHVNMSIISEREVSKYGDKFHIALVQEISPDWHTYWRNHGDVGDKTRIKWQAPNGVKIGDIKWPVPEIIQYGEFVNYGYSGKVIMPISIEIPENFNGPLELVAKIEWLECADVCIPGDKQINFTINIGQNITNSAQKELIDNALNNLPTSFNGTAYFENNPDNLRIGVMGSDAIGAKSAYFFPFEIEVGALIDHAKPQELEIGPKGLSLRLTKSLSLPANLKFPIGGLIKINNGNGDKYYEINAQNGAISPDLYGKKPSTSLDWSKAFGAMFAAFLGGLILNLMPCVFPILALKVFGLMKSADKEHKQARKYGLFYGLGVILTFLVLGIIIFGLKSVGAALGWGFQLQNPIFIYLMAIIMAAIGFNLLGLFEFNINIQNIGNKSVAKEGNISALASGALAVAVASPCTAPFMAAALGYAASTTPIIGLLVFLALGIGFALPYVALTISPKALALLPKPGAWMNLLKQILAIPMFLTAIWLLWVLYKLTGPHGLLSGIIAIAMLCLWLITKQNPNNGKNGKLMAYVFAFSLASGIFANFFIKPVEKTQETNLSHEAWSEAKVNSLRAQGKIVFVNFTADWCITCKVTESTVFNTKKVQEAFEKNNVTYLVADWTNHNEEIQRALSSHGRLGVPLYILYSPSKGEPQILPQLLTPQMVIDAIEKD